MVPRVKNQYVGDINDYFKYSILRALTARSERPLAMCWMLTEDDGSGDGNLTAYLNRPQEFRHLDPVLFDRLGAVIGAGRREVSAVESAQLVPCSFYFSRMLSDCNESRLAYFNDLWDALPPRALVFFDPDNGLEVKSVGRGRRGSRRYLYFDELEEAISGGHLAVVYQHFPRVQRDVYVAQQLDRIRQSLSGVQAAAVYSSRVAYLLVGESRELLELSDALGCLDTRWGGNLKFSQASLMDWGGD